MGCPPQRTISRWLIVSALGLGLLAGRAAAAPAPSLPPPPPEPTVEMPPFYNAPWRQVFNWLCEETGKPVLSCWTPTGGFTYQGPPGKRHTIPEVVALLNEALK